MSLALPLFHLYGDPPDDQAFDFIHIETISARSSQHDWTIRAHRHRNLFQILLIERGGGEMTVEASTLAFAAPSALLMPATVAHGFRFLPRETEGWVVSFTEDVTHGLGGGGGGGRAPPRARARARGRGPPPAGPRSRPTRACRSPMKSSTASRRSAATSTRSASSRARATASPCAAI